MSLPTKYARLKFQHTAARRRLGFDVFLVFCELPFQHTAARRRLALQQKSPHNSGQFQHTAARRRLASAAARSPRSRRVSTHSRPKAAGSGFPTVLRNLWFQHTAARRRLAVVSVAASGWVCGGVVSTQPAGFNTQPPEGGWGVVTPILAQMVSFQHTAARRRLVVQRFA